MADKFVDLEDSEQLVLELAHGELLRLARQKEGLSFVQARVLKLLHEIVTGSKVLALKQFELQKRYGETLAPEPAAAKQIGPVDEDKKH